MKSAFLPIVAVAILTHASPSSAQGDRTKRYEQWEGRLRDRVNTELVYPLGAAGGSGDVLVTFKIGADGKPTEVSVRRSSGNTIFDQAAVRLISHLGHVGPIPSLDRQIEEIVVKLSYGDPATTVGGSMQVAKADHEEQLANERRNLVLVAGVSRLAQSH